MSAEASLTRLSPSRITITRRGTGSRETIAAAATASGGETIAPNATATAHGIPGKSARAATATATDVASTSPMASSAIGRRARLKSRSDVKNAAAQRTGGRKAKKTMSGSSCGRSTPGSSPTPKPAATCRIGTGTGSRRAMAVTATTTAANAMARTIGGKCGIGASAVGERERHVRPAARRAVLAAAAGDDDVLLAVHHVGGGRRVAGRGELRRPEQRPGALVERAEGVVVRRRADEQEPV